jgi:PBP1b-binding outer membrane lipoprotein LpoB
MKKLILIVCLFATGCSTVTPVVVVEPKGKKIVVKVEFHGEG